MPARCFWYSVLLSLVLVVPAGAGIKGSAKGSSRGAESITPRETHATPVNDQCSGAILLTCGNINLYGTTINATDDYTPIDTLISCTNYRAQGKDVVYKMSVGPGDSLWIDYTTITDGSIYLVRDCNNIDFTCVAGADDVALPGETERIRYFFTQGGTYYLIMDSFAPGSSGDWSAVGQLVCGAFTPPENDLWEAATLINCGPFNISGSTQYANPNYTLGAFPCTGHVADGQEVVYKVRVAAGDSLYLEYTSTTDGSVYVVYDGNEPTQTCVWGEDQNIENQIEVVRFRFEFAGTYYIMIDSRNAGTWGTWYANGTLVCNNPPPVNDRCEFATALPCGAINFAGSTQYAYNDYALTDDVTCTGYDTFGRDVVYRMDVAAGDSLSIDYLSSGSDGSIYIVSDCNALDATCVAGADETITDEVEHLAYRFQAPGTYYLVLDSVDNNEWGNWTAVGELQCGPLGVDGVSGAGTLQLRAAWPNPFSRLTALAYTLPTRGRATLRIYDLQGRVARTLVDGMVEPGDHRVTWDGRDDSGARVGPGVYFARLSNGIETVMKRAIFVR